MKAVPIDRSDDGRIVCKSSGSTEAYQEKLDERLREAISNTENTLVEAPTSLGKTYRVATVPWRDYPKITGGKPVIHLHKTTAARDGAANMSEEAGISYTVLKSREICPVAGGNHDNEITAPDGSKPSTWFDKKCDKQGYTFSKVHRYLEEALDGLPCQQDGGCSGGNQWDNILQDDGDPEYDVIHATHQFAQVTPLIEDGNVIVDERPDYTLGIKHRNLRLAINDFFKQHAQSQDHTWPELIVAVTNSDSDTLGAYQDLLEDIPNEPPSLTDNNIHRHTKSILQALISAESTIENRYSGEKGRTSLVIRGNGDIGVIRRQPALSEARCVIGLDAYPSMRLWKQNLGVDLHHTEIVDDHERRKWRQNKRGLQIIQVGDNTRSFTTGWRKDTDQRLKAKSIIQAIHSRHGGSFKTCITANRIEDDVESIMVEDGIMDADTMHYGEQNSRNDFKNENIGLLIGCNDPGDGWILNMLAEQGLEAQSEVYEDSGERAHGREFVGPDSDAAREFLKSVREENIAQSIGRYARNSEDSEDAIVYVWTDAISYGLADEKVPGVIRNITETKRDMFNVVEKQGPVTTRKVEEQVDSTKEYIRRTFNEWVEQGILNKSEKSGKWGANEFDTTNKDLSPLVDIDVAE